MAAIERRLKARRADVDKVPLFLTCQVFMRRQVAEQTRLRLFGKALELRPFSGVRKAEIGRPLGMAPNSADLRRLRALGPLRWAERQSQPL